MEINFISPEETYILRSEVLHPGAPITSVALSGDRDVNTFHLGVFLNSELISVGSFLKESHALFDEPNQYRLRKMATSPHHRGVNAGSKLIAFGKNLLKQKDIKLLWCDARETAIGFYEKSGFVIASNFFSVPGVGLHKVMYIKV